MAKETYTLKEATIRLRELGFKRTYHGEYPGGYYDTNRADSFTIVIQSKSDNARYESVTKVRVFYDKKTGIVYKVTRSETQTKTTNRPMPIRELRLSSLAGGAPTLDDWKQT